MTSHRWFRGEVDEGLILRIAKPQPTVEEASRAELERLREEIGAIANMAEIGMPVLAKLLRAALRGGGE